MAVEHPHVFFRGSFTQALLFAQQFDYVLLVHLLPSTGPHCADVSPQSITSQSLHARVHSPRGADRRELEAQRAQRRSATEVEVSAAAGADCDPVYGEREVLELLQDVPNTGVQHTSN